MGLAMRTGITPEQWLCMDPRDLDTALVLVAEEQEEAERARKGRK